MASSSDFSATFWAQLSTVVVSLGAVAVAYYGVRRQAQRSREAAGLDLLFRLVDGWDSHELRQRRANLARRLQGARPFAARGNPVSFDRNALDILNSFEYLGFLVVTAEVVTARMARKVLGPWAVCYWLVFQNAFALAADMDEAAFDQFHALVRGILLNRFRTYKTLPMGLDPDLAVSELKASAPPAKFQPLTLSQDTVGQLRSFLASECLLAPPNTEAEAAANLGRPGAPIVG